MAVCVYVLFPLAAQADDADDADSSENAAGRPNVAKRMTTLDL